MHPACRDFQSFLKEIDSAGIGGHTPPDDAPTGVVVAGMLVANLGDGTAAAGIAQRFGAATAKHWHRDRANVDAVPV